MVDSLFSGKTSRYLPSYSGQLSVSITQSVISNEYRQSLYGHGEEAESSPT